MRNTSPVFGKDQRQVGGIGSTTKTIGTLQFYFHFGEREYAIKFNIVPGPTPQIISHKDLNNLSLNYQTLYKSIDRPDEGYSEK